MGVLALLVPFVPLITPFAARWVREQEAAILADGIALSRDQAEDARQVGVASPELIRLKFVDKIPVPGRLLGELGLRTGLVSPNTAGITLGYGIYIKSRYRHDRGLCVHECVHVGQYERLGSIDHFLRAYLKECLDPGYPLGPLEQEAIVRANDRVRGG